MLKQRVWGFFNHSLLLVQSDLTFLSRFSAPVPSVSGHYSPFILRFDRDAYNAQAGEGVKITDEGAEPEVFGTPKTPGCSSTSANNSVTRPDF